MANALQSEDTDEELSARHRVVVMFALPLLFSLLCLAVFNVADRKKATALASDIVAFWEIGSIVLTASLMLAAVKIGKPSLAIIVLIYSALVASLTLLLGALILFYSHAM